MQATVEKLYKYLKLEADRGYDNRAVVGGLDRIIPSWQNEARSDNLDELKVKDLISLLSEYRYMLQEERVIAIQEMLNILKTFETQHNAQTHVPEEPPGEMPNKHVPVIHSPKIQNKEPLRPVSTVQQASPPSARKIAMKAPLTVLQGVGTRTAENFKSLGLLNLADLLYHFPRRYDDYSQLKPINRLQYDDELTVLATVRSIQNRKVRNGRLELSEAVLSDDSGFLRVTWFNHPWYVGKFPPGSQVVLSGKIDMYLGKKVMNNPDIEMLDQQHLHTNRIVPVYPLTSQVNQYTMRRSMYQAVSLLAPQVEDILPETTRRSAGLLDLSTALLQIHFPDTQEKLRLARERIAFDEIFLLQFGLLRQKQSWQSATARKYETSQDWIDSQLAMFPYQLTDPQLRAIHDIRSDLSSGKPMNRLLQGDVGCGKTAVAALAIAIASYHNVQSAFMAPTSILAEQHYHSMQDFLANPNHPSPALQKDQIRLLVGDTNEVEKEEIRCGLLDGKIKLVIGTHALIEDPVAFQNLQLIIVDEQHRFGVAQRAALREKGENPHLLVMTATPIPRSMALTVYGDLDLSTIDQMPPGRQPVETHLLHPLDRERAYKLIHTQVNQGHQAFIIYPLVEKGENENRDESQAAVEEHQRLQSDVFPHYQLGLLHGRMNPEEKDAVMLRFRDGEYQILVSTSVVEVGVDIPNATIMLIEGANRFGLAQLHQFRGRVGRGNAHSYCILIPESEDALENERLSAMVETNDGFVLAERDLEQRGPGEFLGTRQSGYSGLKIASITDYHLIEKARKYALELFKSDPALSMPENQALSEAVERFWEGGKGDIS